MHYLDIRLKHLTSREDNNQLHLLSFTVKIGAARDIAPPTADQAMLSTISLINYGKDRAMRRMLRKQRKQARKSRRRQTQQARQRSNQIRGNAPNQRNRAQGRNQGRNINRGPLMGRRQGR